MPGQCAQGFSCPPPTITLDNFVPLGNRYIDIGAGGPSPFTFTVGSNVTWLKLSQTSGSISPNNTEVRLFLSVDWTQVEGVSNALITFNATAQNQPLMTTTAFFVANHSVPTAGFKGKLQSKLSLIVSIGILSHQDLWKATVESQSRLLMLRATRAYLESLGPNFPATVELSPASRLGHALATTSTTLPLVLAQACTSIL